jgi:uncharacterized protein involved in exopolysaccharide biosynthesis
MLNMNQSMLDRVERELDQSEAELRSLRERKFYIESQLAQTNPLTMMRSATGQSILDPVSRLKALESEYASIAAKYSEQHPDVIKIKREIEGLRQQTGSVADSIEIAKQLSKSRSDLKEVSKKYSAGHPDVVALTRKVERLEKELAAYDSFPENRVIEQNSDNPAYISLKTQQQTIETEMASILERQQRLKEKRTDYESRLAKSPQVERKYQVLLRDHKNASMRYQDIRARQMEAEIGQELEKESKGESFQLIDPAQFPEQPVKPNRLVIVFLSFVFSVGCGLGYVFLAEGLDASIRGVSGVAAILTAPPLAIIPTIYTPNDYFKRRRTNRILIGSTIAGFVLALLAIHFFFSPLDVLWFRSVRKAENIIGI